MKDTIIDYAIYAMLLVMLLAMVGSALMLIKTMSVEWYFITAAITTTAMVINYVIQRYDDDEP